MNNTFKITETQALRCELNEMQQQCAEFNAQKALNAELERLRKSRQELLEEICAQWGVDSKSGPFAINTDTREISRTNTPPPPVEDKPQPHLLEPKKKRRA